LEIAVLHAILAETPEWRTGLEQQLNGATVLSRQNTGVGFFTLIVVPAQASRVGCPNALGHDVHAQVPGLTYGLGFVLFLKDGRLRMLEGYAVDTDSTAGLHLENMTFEVRKGGFGK